MDNEDVNEILEAIAEDFDKYPFDMYHGLEVAEMIREKKFK